MSTRKPDDLVRALGIDAGIGKNEASRICGVTEQGDREVLGLAVGDSESVAFGAELLLRHRAWVSPASACGSPDACLDGPQASMPGGTIRRCS